MRTLETIPSPKMIIDLCLVSDLTYAPAFLRQGFYIVRWRKEGGAHPRGRRKGKSRLTLLPRRTGVAIKDQQCVQVRILS